MDRQLAEDTKRTAEGIVETMKLMNSCGDPYNVYGTLIRTLHTLSDIHKKAVGTALILTDGYTIEEA